jgi:hypothetical protein
MPVLNMPIDPPTKATKTKRRIWEKKVDEYFKGEMHLQENLKTLYSLIIITHGLLLNYKSEEPGFSSP